MPITHKFFEELSSDDKPWGVEYDSVSDLVDFLTYPSGWVAKHISLNCVLRRDFIIKLRMATVAPPDTGNFYMTGNSGTDLVIIFVPEDFIDQFTTYIRNLLAGEQEMFLPPGSPSPSDLDLQQLIGSIATIPSVQLDTLVITKTGSTQGRAITHFSITDGKPAPSAPARLLIVAKHLGEMIADPRYIEKILNAPANHTVTFRDPDGKPNPPNPLPIISFTPFTCPGDVAMEYVGDEASSLEACNLLVALYNDGKITAEEAYIKAYS